MTNGQKSVREQLEEEGLIQRDRLFYHSRRFTKDKPFDPRNEQTEYVEIIQQTKDGKIRSFEIEARQVSRNWHRTETEKEGFYVGEAPYLQHGADPKFMKSKRFRKFLRNWCVQKFFSKTVSKRGNKYGSLPEVLHVYLTIEGSKKWVNELESQAIEHLWKYSKPVFREDGQYMLTYYRKHLDNYFWKQYIKRAGEKNNQLKTGLNFEKYTQRYSKKTRECGWEKAVFLKKEEYE